MLQKIWKEFSTFRPAFITSLSFIRSTFMTQGIEEESAENPGMLDLLLNKRGTFYALCGNR